MQMWQEIGFLYHFNTDLGAKIECGLVHPFLQMSVQANQKHVDGLAVVLVKTSHLHVILCQKHQTYLLFKAPKIQWKRTKSICTLTTTHWFTPSAKLSTLLDHTFGAKEVELSLCRAAPVRHEAQREGITCGRYKSVLYHRPGLTGLKMG